jgi:xylose isomerase
MNEFFPKIKKIKYEGRDSKNPMAFKHYKANQKIMGKTMAEHLRFAVCYWHTLLAYIQGPRRRSVRSGHDDSQLQ